MIAGAETEIGAIIKPGCAYDLAGIEQMMRIEAVLDLLECAHQTGAEHRFVEFRSNKPVAMLSRMGALVFAHESKSLLGDCPHRVLVLLEPQVENRAHVQAAYRRMGIPGATSAVFFEHLCEAIGIFGKVLKRHRAVLHKGDRLALLLHGHHDVETCGTDIRDGGLK